MAWTPAEQQHLRAAHHLKPSTGECCLRRPSMTLWDNIRPWEEKCAHQHKHCFLTGRLFACAGARQGCFIRGTGVSFGSHRAPLTKKSLVRTNLTNRAANGKVLHFPCLCQSQETGHQTRTGLRFRQKALQQTEYRKI